MMSGVCGMRIDLQGFILFVYSDNEIHLLEEIYETSCSVSLEIHLRCLTSMSSSVFKCM